MIEELPSGWAATSVATLIEDVKTGFASGEKKVENGVAHLRMNNVGRNGDLDLDLIRRVPEKLAKPDYDLRPGDVLVCTTNSAKLVGKCAYFDLVGRYTFSNHLTRLRPKPGVVDGRFLRWNLWLQWKSGVFDDQCKNWVNQSTIPKDVLLETQVVLPPLSEQVRIVEELEKLLAKVEECQKRLERIPAVLKRFRRSVLAAAAAGRLTADWRQQISPASSTEDVAKLQRARLALSKSQEEHAKIVRTFSSEAVVDATTGWVALPAWLVCDFITKGTTPTNNGITEAGEVPFLKVYNIVDNKINFEYKSQFVSHKVHTKLLARSKVYPGDILMNIVGPPLGKIALVPDQFPEWNINQALAIFRPVDSVLPAFLQIALMGGESLNDIISETRGIVGQSNISLEQCRSLLVSVPSRLEQQEIVRRVHSLFDLADEIELGFEKARTHVDKLTPSLLAQSFRGELVPTEATVAKAEGRRFESAEELLKRITINANGTAAPNRRQSSPIA